MDEDQRTYWKDKCILLPSSSFFLCKTFRLRSSLEINWHGFARCSRAAVIYEGPMRFKSCQLWQRQRAYCRPRSPSPPAPGPHLTALPDPTLKPGWVEVVSPTSTPVLTWEQEGAELWPCPSAGEAGVIAPAALGPGKAKAPCGAAPWRPQAASAGRPRGCGGLSLPRTPSVSQPERGAPHPAWPRNSPSLPPEPLQALGLPFSGPLK